MDISEGDTQPVRRMDRSFDANTSFEISERDTHKVGAIVLRPQGDDQTGATPGFIEVTLAQLEYTIRRIALISVGVSWANHLTMHEAGIMASHTVVVELCRLRIPSDDKIQDLIKEVVTEGLSRYYNVYGQPYTRPKGKVEINFVRKAKPN